MLGELIALGGLATFSANIIITKVASGRLNLHFGFLVSVSVNVLFAVLLLGIQSLLRGNWLQWDTTGFLLFLIAGFFSTYLGRYFFFDSIALLGPAKASIFQTSNPLFTVIIAWVFLDENLSFYDVTAIVLILFGLFLVSYVPGVFSKRTPTETPTEAGEIKTSGSHITRALLGSGIFLGLFGALSYAVGNVLRGVAIQTWNEPILGALIGAALGLSLHFITSSHTRQFWLKLKQADRSGLRLYVLSGVLTISGQICAIASMRYIPVSLANLITMSTPILVTPLSYYLLRNQEGINWRTIVGSAAVLLGITLILLY